MPPKSRGAGKATTARKATPAQGDNPDPERFTAGTGPLADEMATSFEDTAVRAQAIRLQKLGAEGAPVGEPVRVDSTTTTMAFTPDDSGIDLEVDKALDAAPVPDASIEFETSDPATVALVRDVTRVPLPTAVINEWFPAYFRPVGESQPWAPCKVFLTPQGLYVYRTAPEGETFKTGATPAWYAGVDFAETVKPVTGYAAMNAGIPITTTAGKVNVQPYGGCGCSARKLKNWTPSWARNRISWADAVKLIDATAGR